MQIVESKYVISCPSVTECPKPDRLEIAFFGRSNVGKSSLINMICGRDALAKISASPGKTTDPRSVLANGCSDNIFQPPRL